ncbi:putative L-cysteine desulfhydrase 1 [Typha latifolia]|uniref:putative L-cysteine desulfhydrase 1 n=1 Tax=Typha latifolia TaxID=4733 RepID=UPI003C2C726B
MDDHHIVPAENGGNGYVNGAAAADSLKPPPPITAAELASEFSHHDPAVARLNNGSFGCCPSSVLSAQSSYRRLFLSHPEAFFFRHLQPSLLRSRAAVKSLIGARDLSSVSLVDNATTAAAVVLRHVSWSLLSGPSLPGDAVLVLHYAYSAVKKSILAYAARAGAAVIEVPLHFPVSSEHEIIQQFRRSLSLARSDGRRVRLAVIDHITSMPCVVIPVKELIKICREEGVDQVFVDGAHAIGNVEVDVEDIGADFYTSNLHKWFFCPPAVAFLHCRNPDLVDLHHPVVTNEYGNGLPAESGWVGTRDYSAQLIIPDAVAFVNRFKGGIEGIRKRNHEKVVEMGKMLAQAWGTFLGSPPEMCGSMVMVGLPVSLGIFSDGDATRLRNLLRDEFRIEAPMYYNSRKDSRKSCESVDEENNFSVTGYVRISHQVYNVEDDYRRLRDAILKLVRDGFNCAMLQSI